MAFCAAELRPGVELALDALGADRVLEGATFAITAEGMLDTQTLAGKVPVGVARRARRHGVPVVAVGGTVAPLERSTVGRFREAGIVAICPTAEGAATEDELMEADATMERLERTGERIAHLVDLGQRKAKPR
jgi:glycerate 2-kinase